TVVGKPSPGFFAQGVRDLRPEAGRDLARHDIAMVGDDIRTDVRAAQRAGLRGIFVTSGKHSRADAETAAAERGGRRPDAPAAPRADVVPALDCPPSRPPVPSPWAARPSRRSRIRDDVRGQAEN